MPVMAEQNTTDLLKQKITNDEIRRMTEQALLNNRQSSLDMFCYVSEMKRMIKRVV